MSYPWRDEERLREMYLGEGMSMAEIADEFDTGSTTIQRWLDRFDIDTRKSPQERPVCYRTEDRGYEVWRYDTGSTQYKVRVHRLVAVAEHGLEAVSEMEVHHKNMIPWDNRPDNIELLTDVEHGHLHNSDGAAKA